jgi:hypothetical protein
VHFDRMRESPAARRQKGGEYEKGDYSGEVVQTEAKDHYTQIILKRIGKTSRQLFAGEGNKSSSTQVRSLYGMNRDSVHTELSDPKLTSWSEFDDYSQNMLQVALNVPIAYYDDWVPKNCANSTREFAQAAKELNFTLKYDGTELRKPIVLLPPQGKKCIVVPFAYSGENVSASGYFYVQHGGIKPHDLHGLLLRIRNAAVGSYDTDFLDFPPSEGSLIQRWVSAEIWADDRLEEAMNIDRKTLRVTELAYTELQSAIHSRLRKVIAAARNQLYKQGNEERVHVKATDAVSRVVRMTDRESGLTEATSRQVATAWKQAASPDSPAHKALLRRYDVAELYGLVIEVARDVLAPKDLNEFVRRLTARLSK